MLIECYNLLFFVCFFAKNYDVTYVYYRTRLFSVWANDLEENLCTETCQRLVAAFQNNFDIESPVLASKQQRIIDFNLSLRRLLNEASMRLHQASLQLAEEDVHSGSNERIMVQYLRMLIFLRSLYKSFHYCRNCEKP